MAQASAPAELTPAQIAQVQIMRAYAQAMIRAVAQVGRTTFLEETQAFQFLWNDQQKLVDKAAALNGSPPYWYELVPDGKYGPKTAGALRFVVSKNVPDRSDGMPTWYAANHAFVESLVAPSDVAAQQTLETATSPLDEHSAQGAVDPEALVEEARQGGNGSTSIPISPSPPLPSSGRESMWCNDLPAGERQACWMQRHDVVDAAGGKCKEVMTPEGQFDVVCEDWATAMGVADDMLDFDPATEQPRGVEIQTFETPDGYETRVVAAPTKGRVPLVALGVGAAALGGVLYYFTRRRRRR